MCKLLLYYLCPEFSLYYFNSCDITITVTQSTTIEPYVCRSSHLVYLSLRSNKWSMRWVEMLKASVVGVASRRHPARRHQSTAHRHHHHHRHKMVTLSTLTDGYHAMVNVERMCHYVRPLFATMSHKPTWTSVYLVTSRRRSSHATRPSNSPMATKFQFRSIIHGR